METVIAAVVSIILIRLISSQFKKQRFVWDKAAEEFVIQCYIKARNEAKPPITHVGPLCGDLFRKRYTQCKVTNDAIKIQILRLKEKYPEIFFDLPTPSQPPQPNSSQQTQYKHEWTEEREFRLWQLAAKAFSIEDLRQISNHYKGLRQRPSGLFKILSKLYREDQDLQEDDLSDDAVRIKFHRVVEKYGAVEPLPEHTQEEVDQATIDVKLRNAMTDNWKFCKDPIFDFCCSMCGSMLWGELNRGHKFSLYKANDDCVARKRFHGYKNLLPFTRKIEENKFCHYYCGSCFQRIKSNRPCIPEIPIFNYYDPKTGYAKRPKELEPDDRDLSLWVKNQIGLLKFDYNVAKRSVPMKQSYLVNRGYLSLRHKINDAYYGMYGFVTEKSSQLASKVPKHENAELMRIAKAALLWLKNNNRLFKYLFANMETLYGYCAKEKGFINFYDIPGIQPKFGDEFDHGKEDTLLHVPAKGTEPKYMDPNQSYAALQHPLPNTALEDVRKNLRAFTYVNHFDPNKENKAFPWLYPHGLGGFVRKQNVRRSEFVKQKLLCIDQRWTKDLLWSYYQNNESALDLYYHTIHNNVASNKVRDHPVNCADVLHGFKEEEYAVGRPILHSLSGSLEYWRKQTYNLLALKDFMDKKRGKGKGHPDFFLTLTINESWPEIQAFVKHGPQGKPDVGDVFTRKVSRGGNPATNDVTAVTVAAQKRLNYVMQKIHKEKPLGEIEEYFIRAEYQNRGAIHWHILLWCKPGTIPEDAVSAEVPSGPEFEGDMWDKHRERIVNYQTHNCVAGKCRPLAGGDCKLGFPFEVNHTLQLDKTGKRYLYVRRDKSRDANIVPYNRYILEWLDGHHNVQYVSESHWLAYLVKYTTKLGTYNVKIPASANIKEQCITMRDISRMETHHSALQFPSVQCSREIIFLSTDLDPKFRVLKNKYLLENMDPTSTDVFFYTKLDHYLNRPLQLKNVSYAEYYRKYDYTYNMQKDGWPDRLNPKRRVFKRNREAVVRWHLVHLMKDPKEFAMQQLILHVPFVKADGSDLFSNENREKDPLQECILRAKDYPDIKFGSEREMALHFLETSKSKGFSANDMIKLVEEMEEKGYLETDFCEIYIEELEKERTETAKILEDYNVVSDVDDADKMFEIQKLDEAQIIADFTREASTGQREIFFSVNEWVKREKGELGRNPNYKKSQILKFITGGAGVGKTYMLKAIMAIFQWFSVPYQSLAYTGVASRIAKGNTIHNFFQLSLNLKCRLDPTSIQGDLIRNCDVLIIDEVSMLPASLFHVIQQILSNYRNPRCDHKRPFGGRSVILVGDPAQLPTIRGRGIWYETLFYEYFDVYNLTEIKRTRDHEFKAILNTIRQGVVDKQVDEFLQKRVIHCSIEDLPQLVSNVGVFLCARRAEKDKYNDIKLSMMEGPCEEYPANDYDMNRVPLPTAKRNALVKSSKTLLPTNLKLKVGCRVIVLKNIDTRHGWVNGTIARVENLYRDYIIVRDIENRQNRKVILRYEEDISPKGKEGTAFRNQFPLDLAYGLTIHKTQGLSIPEVYINMDNAWESGQIYVAISRCQHPDKLKIINYNKDKIIISQYFRQLLVWISQTSLLRTENKELISNGTHPRELEQNKIPVPKSKAGFQKEPRKKILNIDLPEPEDSEENSETTSSSNGAKTDEETEYYRPLLKSVTPKKPRKHQRSPTKTIKSPEKKRLEIAVEEMEIEEEQNYFYEDDKEIEADIDEIVEREEVENIHSVNEYDLITWRYIVEKIRDERNASIKSLSERSLYFLKSVREELKRHISNSEFEDKMTDIINSDRGQNFSKELTQLLYNTSVKIGRNVIQDEEFTTIVETRYHRVITDHYSLEVTPGDGDCFYNAVSQLLFGTPTHFNIIRAACVFAFFRQISMFKRFMENNGQDIRENVWTTCHNLCSVREWAKNEQMAMISLACVRPYFNFNIRGTAAAEPFFKWPERLDIAGKTDDEIHRLIGSSEPNPFYRFDRVLPWFTNNTNLTVNILRQRDPLTLLFHMNHFIAMVPRRSPVVLRPGHICPMYGLNEAETIREAQYIFQCTGHKIFDGIDYE